MGPVGDYLFKEVGDSAKMRAGVRNPVTGVIVLGSIGYSLYQGSSAPFITTASTAALILCYNYMPTGEFVPSVVSGAILATAWIGSSLFTSREKENIRLKDSLREDGYQIS